MKKLITVFLVVAFGFTPTLVMAKHSSHHYNSHNSNYDDSNSNSNSNSNYDDRCSGKHYCSDVHTYAEAKWVLNNCPDVHMDGDDDNIPCERQFNKH